MKRLAILFSVLVYFSCGNKKDIPSSDSNGRQPVIDSQILADKENTNKITDWEKFENEVFESIEMLQNSDSSNRRTRIEKFISYADKVDGAVAEGYSNFAFEYADNNYQDFYSSLSIADTSVIDLWAKSASMEIMIIAENQEIEFAKNFSKKYKLKIIKLPSAKQGLAHYYLDKLNEYAKGEWLPK